MASPDKFMNTYQTRFDAKGRISIPAPYRAALRIIAGDGSATVILRPSHVHRCIEAWPPSLFEEWAARQRELDDPAADADDLDIRLFSDTIEVEPDKEGRIVLDHSLVKYASLTETVSCAGLGNRFQLWDPVALERRKLEARQGGAKPGTAA